MDQFSKEDLEQFSKEELDQIKEDLDAAFGNKTDLSPGKFVYDDNGFKLKNGWFSKSVKWNDVTAITAYIPKKGLYNTKFRLQFELGNSKKVYIDEDDSGFLYLLEKIKEKLSGSDVSFVMQDRPSVRHQVFSVYTRSDSF